MNSNDNDDNDDNADNDDDDENLNIKATTNKLTEEEKKKLINTSLWDENW